MPPQETPNPVPTVGANAFNARDVAEILHEKGWLLGDATSAQIAWCERAAALLGPHVSDRNSLGDLLQLIFHYDAREILAKVESHSALSRSGAREVLRHLALLLLDGAPLTTDHFKEVVNSLKETVGLRSRELFHPIRLAIAGRVGEGDLDRIILLLDEAANLSFAVSVKSARQRIVEFCAALD